MNRGRKQQVSIMADYGLLRVKGFGEWHFQRRNIPGRVCKYHGLDSLKILLVYTKKSFMEESGNEPENASVICALLPLSACVTLAPRQAATVMMNNGVCIRVPAQSGERLDWLEIMRSDQPSSTILHYDVTHPVWVFPRQCLLTSDFRFVAGKSYAVLVTTVVNEKEARQYEARFETGKGAR